MLLHIACRFHVTGMFDNDDVDDANHVEFRPATSEHGFCLPLVNGP